MKNDFFRSKAVQTVYNTCDLPIRAVYSHAPFVGDIVKKRLFWKIYSSDLSMLEAQFRSMSALLCKHDIKPKDKIGTWFRYPGHPEGCSDKRDTERPTSAFYRKKAGYLEGRGRNDIVPKGYPLDRASMFLILYILFSLVL
jgi:hypothetical protein